MALKQVSSMPAARLRSKRVSRGRASRNSPTTAGTRGGAARAAGWEGSREARRPSARSPERCRPQSSRPITELATEAPKAPSSNCGNPKRHTRLLLGPQSPAPGLERL